MQKITISTFEPKFNTKYLQKQKRNQFDYPTESMHTSIPQTNMAWNQFSSYITFKSRKLNYTEIKYERALRVISQKVDILSKKTSDNPENILNEIVELYKKLINKQKDRAKQIISKYNPSIAEQMDKIAKLDNMKSIFTNIHDNNLWGSQESVSGSGSEIQSMHRILQRLPIILNKYQIKTILDAPCGDFNWMRMLNYDFDKYIGMDIVDDLILNNKKKYGNESREFISANILEMNLPASDLILCKDLFIHFSNADIIQTLKNFKKSGSKYLLTTNYKMKGNNKDIKTGYFRPLDLTNPPFNLNSPILTILENKKENKYLALWNLRELNI